MDAELLRAAEGGDMAAMRQVVALLAEKHNITIKILATMPPGVGAYAQWHKRAIVIQEIVDAAGFATALHEIGHVIAGKCTGRAPHQPDPRVQRWHHCLACENAASEIALTLAPFSRSMHAEIARGLKAYRRSTPGPASEVARLDRLASGITYCRAKQGRVRMQLRHDMVKQWRAEAEKKTPNEKRREMVAKWMREAQRG